MDSDTLLAHFARRWEALTQTLEGVPHQDFEDFRRPGQPTIPTIKEICALLTAWDGEALRRIDFITGLRFEAPHDWHDTSYWETWSQRQIEVKAVMPPQGILVDMVGTRQRLLSCIADLTDYQLERWLAEDPQATQPYYDEYLQEIKHWRVAWDEAHPPPQGVKKVWQSLQNRFQAKG